MEPFKLTDHDGASLEVLPCAHGQHGYIAAGSRDGLVCVHPADIPDVANALYEAAGQKPPVRLGRPGVDTAKPAVVGSLRVWKEADGRVGFMPADAARASVTGALRLRPHEVRRLAAVAVAYADAEADQGDVHELAAVLAEHPGATFPELARAVLADGRFGRTGGAR